MGDYSNQYLHYNQPCSPPTCQAHYDPHHRRICLKCVYDHGRACSCPCHQMQWVKPPPPEKKEKKSTRQLTLGQLCSLPVAEVEFNGDLPTISSIKMNGGALSHFAGRNPNTRFSSNYDPSQGFHDPSRGFIVEPSIRQRYPNSEMAERPMRSQHPIGFGGSPCNNKLHPSAYGQNSCDDDADEFYRRDTGNQYNGSGDQGPGRYGFNPPVAYEW